MGDRGPETAHGPERDGSPAKSLSDGGDSGIHSHMPDASGSPPNDGWRQSKDSATGRGPAPPPPMYMQHPPMQQYMMNQPPSYRGYGGPGYSMAPPGGMYGPPPHGYYPPPPYTVQHHPYPVQQQSSPKTKGKTASSPTKPHGPFLSVNNDASAVKDDGKFQISGSVDDTKDKEGCISNAASISSEAKSPASEEKKKEEEEKIDQEGPLEAAPMRHDFHFYYDDHFDDTMKEAQNRLQRILSLENGEVGKIDPIILFTSMNESLMSRWEGEPHETRETYRQKEDADRIRFMQEDEVASRHCATLTARSEKKALATSSPEKNSPDKEKNVISSQSQTPEKAGSERDVEAKTPPSHEKGEKMKEEKVRPPSSPSAEDDSPAKKIKESPPNDEHVSKKLESEPTGGERGEKLQGESEDEQAAGSQKDGDGKDEINKN